MSLSDYIERKYPDLADDQELMERVQKNDKIVSQMKDLISKYREKEEEVRELREKETTSSENEDINGYMDAVIETIHGVLDTFTISTIHDKAVEKYEKDPKNRALSSLIKRGGDSGRDQYVLRAMLDIIREDIIRELIRTDERN